MKFRVCAGLLLTGTLLMGCAVSDTPSIDARPGIVNRELIKFSTNPLKVSDAVRLGVLSSTEVAAAELVIQQSDNEIAIAKASFYPEFYVNASPSTNDGQLANAGAGFRYTLFDFGARAAERDSKKAAFKGSKYDLLVKIEDSVSEVLQSYIALSIENTKLNAARHYVRSVRDMEKGVRARVEIGIASSVDMNELQSARIKADTAVLEAQTDQSNAHEALASLLGVFPRSVHSPDQLYNALAIKPQSHEQLNFQGFPRINALEAQVEEAEFQKKAAQAGLLPKLGLKLGVDLGLSKSGELSGNGIKAGPEISEVVSLGGGRKQRIQNAEIDVRLALRKRDEEIRLARLEAIQAKNSLIASSDRVKRRRSILSLTRQTRDTMQGEYEVGSRSLRDLLDAEERIYDAGVELNEARRINLVALLRYIMSVNKSSQYFYEQPS